MTRSTPSGLSQASKSLSVPETPGEQPVKREQELMGLEADTNEASRIAVGQTNNQLARSMVDGVSAEMHFDQMRALFAAGGPRPEQYQWVHQWLERSAALLADGCIQKENLFRLWHEAGGEYLSETMQGIGLTKPYGYAGDFEMIDRIYLGRVTSSPKHARWDHFFHAQSAPKAVRNRKAFFQSLLASILEARHGTVRLLNLGSGPCRELAEFLERNPDAPLCVECVDQDPRAIAYARSILRPITHRSELRFHEANVVRFRPPSNYDLIWSAGLFDYLPDRLFILVLQRLLNHLSSESQIVIGNFRVGQPSQTYMELMGDWILQHRTEQRMVELAMAAGAPRGAIKVTAEEEGVNLFLVVRGPGSR
jgi:extracellular factor (EF) 3-hydroxypalmitic acid methyl ester biosynthesis protein